MFGLTPKRLLVIALIFAVVFLAAQYVPPYVNHYQLRDAVQQIVRYAAPNRRTSIMVRRDVSAKAQEAGVDLTPEDITIERDGSAVTLSFAYDWPINLRVYRHSITFEVIATGESFGP